MITEQCLNLFISAVITRGQPPPVLHRRVSSVAEKEMNYGDIIANYCIVQWSEARIADKVIDVRAELMVSHRSHYEGEGTGGEKNKERMFKVAT